MTDEAERHNEGDRRENDRRQTFHAVLPPGIQVDRRKGDRRIGSPHERTRKGWLASLFNWKRDPPGA